MLVLVDWSQVPALGEVGFVAWLGQALGTSKTGAALQAATRYTFVAAGVASLLLALLSLAVPHTPPRRAREGVERLAWLEAMKLLRKPFVLVLFIVTFFDAAVHQCYFIWTGRFLTNPDVGIPGNWVMPVMSIGQVAELGTMALLGYVLKRLGWRKTMTLGVLGHALRFVLDGVSKTAAWAELITGVPSRTIENLAKQYATRNRCIAHFWSSRTFCLWGAIP